MRGPIGENHIQRLAPGESKVSVRLAAPFGRGLLAPGVARQVGGDSPNAVHPQRR